MYIYSVCSKSKKNIPLLCTMQCKICTSPYAISSSNVISYFEEKMISFFLKDFQMSFKSSYITENRDIWNLNLSQKKPKKWERKKYFSLNPTALYFDPKMTDGNFIPFCSRIAVVKFKEPTTKYCQRIFDGENSQKFYYLLNLTSFFKKNHSQSMYCKGNIYTQNCPASFHRKQKMEK